MMRVHNAWESSECCAFHGLLLCAKAFDGCRDPSPSNMHLDKECSQSLISKRCVSTEFGYIWQQGLQRFHYVLVHAEAFDGYQAPDSYRHTLSILNSSGMGNPLAQGLISRRRSIAEFGIPGDGVLRGFMMHGRVLTFSPCTN